MAYATILDYLLASFSPTASESDTGVDGAASEREPAEPGARVSESGSETA